MSPADAGYLANWTLPDNGFVLQSAGALTPADWKNVDAVPVTVGQQRQAVLPKSVLPAGTQAFFRLFRPVP